MNPIANLKTPEDRKIGRRIQFLAKQVIAETMDGNDLIEAVANARHVYVAMVASDAETVDKAIADAGSKSTPAELAMMIAKTLSNYTTKQRLDDELTRRVDTARAVLGDRLEVDDTVASLLAACDSAHRAGVQSFDIGGTTIPISNIRYVCRGLTKKDDIRWSVVGNTIRFDWYRGHIRLSEGTATWNVVRLVQTRTVPRVEALPVKSKRRARKAAATDAQAPSNVVQMPTLRPLITRRHMALVVSNG